MKRVITILLVVALAICTISLLSCQNSTTRTQKDLSSKIANNEEIRVGVIQYLSHPSLDNCYNGIEQALNASGLNIKIERLTGSSATADSDAVTHANNLVASNVDMIIAIATPAAQAAYAAAADSDIPVIFCAVSDPVTAKLVESNEKPGDLCTGTSDVLDFDAQVSLITSFQPNVKKIGVLYTSSEQNSISQLEAFKKVCQTKNIEVVAKAVTNASEIPAQAEDLASKVDCINNFTDNNVVNNLSVLLGYANQNKIPVYGSEEEQVKNGCMASVSIDYVALGKTTGNMAVDIIKGEDIHTYAVQTIKEATPVINRNVCESLKISIPEAYNNATFVDAK